MFSEEEIRKHALALVLSKLERQFASAGEVLQTIGLEDIEYLRSFENMVAKLHGKINARIAELER